MTRTDFHELLRRVDDRYQGRPEALKRSTTAWVRLGVAVVAAWLLFLFGLAGAAFVLGVVIEPPGGLFFLAIGVGLALYAIAQAGLFLLLEPLIIGGQPLGPGEAPELAELLDGLRRELGCRPFDEVRITLEFNAGVSEVARLGVFGWPRTVLEVGMPLLLVLSPAEFRAVLAHEFVHLSARHGRGGARIHRLHRMWATLFARLNKPGAGVALKGAHWAASWFVGWYWPRLEARSLALSRHHEYHADRVAAGIAGAETLASALWRLECRGPWLAECFWSDLHRSATAMPEPPAAVLDRLRDALLVPLPPPEAARRAERALARRTVRDETHPAFIDRASALGRSEPEILALNFPSDQPSPAAVDLLGVDRDRLIREQSARWRDAERAPWRERHRRAVAEARRRPPARDPAPAGDARGPEDLAILWGAAREAVDLHGPEAAEPLLRAVLERSPAHPGASVLLGHHLLSRSDAAGEPLLWDVAAAGDEQWTPAACHALDVHHRGTGRADLQRDARDRLDRHEAEVEKARAERSVVGAGDAFLPHALPDETIEALRAVLASRDGGTAAWLARKAVRHFPDRPLFVLAVRSAPGRWGVADADRDASLVKDLVPKVQLPGQVLVVTRSGSFGKLARKVESLPASSVFPTN